MGKIIILSDVENESYVSHEHKCLSACLFNGLPVYMFQRGVAEVEWSKTGLITTCRLGQDGNVKFIC